MSFVRDMDLAGETKFGQIQVWPDQVGPDQGRRRLHTNTAYVRLSGFNGPAGDAPHEGLLKLKGV